MEQNQKYLLDTNVFREAHKRYYAFDICPDFWTFLLEGHMEGLIYSIDEVKKELLAPSDEEEDGQKKREELKNWVVEKTQNSMFVFTKGQEETNWVGKFINSKVPRISHISVPIASM